MSPTLTSLEDFANFPLIWILPLSATSFATDRLLMIRDIFKNLSNRISYSSLFDFFV